MPLDDENVVKERKNYAILLDLQRMVGIPRYYESLTFQNVNIESCWEIWLWGKVCYEFSLARSPNNWKWNKDEKFLLQGKKMTELFIIMRSFLEQRKQQDHRYA